MTPQPTLEQQSARIASLEAQFSTLAMDYWQAQKAMKALLITYANQLQGNWYETLADDCGLELDSIGFVKEPELRKVKPQPAPEQEPRKDAYGNPLNEEGSCDELIYCCFPDCGCDGARLCMAPSGANRCSMHMNFERGTKPAVIVPEPQQAPEWSMQKVRQLLMNIARKLK